MISTNKVMMLIRREFWENRSLWIAPLVISGVILLAALFGGIHSGGNPSFPFGPDAEHTSLAQHINASQRDIGYAIGIAAITMIQMVALAILVFFYLLDALLAERKDRSILFWKSLPISDTQVVLSKLLTAMVLAPLFVLLVSALMQVAFAGICRIASRTPYSNSPR